METGQLVGQHQQVGKEDWLLRVSLAFERVSRTSRVLVYNLYDLHIDNLLSGLGMQTAYAGGTWL